MINLIINLIAHHVKNGNTTDILSISSYVMISIYVLNITNNHCYFRLCGINYVMILQGFSLMKSAPLYTCSINHISCQTTTPSNKLHNEKSQLGKTISSTHNNIFLIRLKNGGNILVWATQRGNDCSLNTCNYVRTIRLGTANVAQPCTWLSTAAEQQLALRGVTGICAYSPGRRKGREHLKHAFFTSKTCCLLPAANRHREKHSLAQLWESDLFSYNTNAT